MYFWQDGDSGEEARCPACAGRWLELRQGERVVRFCRECALASPALPPRPRLRPAPWQAWIADGVGTWLQVESAPHEPRGGRAPDPTIRALVYQTAAGRWIEAVPLYAGVRVEDLTHHDLLELLALALAGS